MNHFNEEQIQTTLRRAPQPRPPTGLKERLLMNARVDAQSSVGQSPVNRFSPGWFRRWWPALLPAGLSMVCVVVLAVQQQEIHRLQKSIDALSQSLTNSAVNAPVKPPSNAAKTAPADHDQEIAALQETARKLRADITEQETLRTANQKLHTQLAAPVPGLLSPEETQAMMQARDRAERIACVNNMKQMGLAVRIWAGDNADRYPPDVVCMSNELSTAKILICPGDHDRPQARDFGSFTMANCSYEWFLSPPGSDTEPTRVLTRCPVHGNIGLYDGSVQMGAAKDHPDWLIERDGKLYFEPPAVRPANPSGGATR